ncbi:hypothetical protein Y032_0018g3652 [Ancylostoma ceylanicum]|uniref:Uncharacterized protein n=1 Tax=Ancylostoma ceylanicum TaxID=53326 RepID=A0A016V2V6_9BILA|nr:hypothetical protein Y032_0018g3652 [Ancylostoma ceylanicum]
MANISVVDTALFQSYLISKQTLAMGTELMNQPNTSESRKGSARKTLKRLKSAFSAPQRFSKTCFGQLVSIFITSMQNY